MKKLMLLGAFCVIAVCFAANDACAHLNRPFEPNVISQSDNANSNFYREANSRAETTSATTRAFKITLSDIPGKILKTFHRDFPDARSETSYQVGDSYMIYFKNDEGNIACRVYYNSNGDILKTIKYYQAENLAPFIRSKVNSKFKGKNISAVTDVTSESGHFYQIVLEDRKSWIYINVSEQGYMQVVKRLQKQK